MQKYEEYKQLMIVPPEQRTLPYNNILDDKIAGILIGFSKMLEIRNNWIDFITVSDATREIKQLINEEKCKH